ncbi:DUF72 domain-containing protein [Tunturiibacter gelidoferens]|uniref:Uncharacterized protein YecE (DUF72 family) n=1 Tax=Tunturiibacter lichenicola TaxID=2051959 RepID=A0A7Y9NJ32_9BACT|nr:DUF72 domain-containing protein [Edaphobacter lichenicola]NYF50239.1 uncharacterized protein YecE (DUF72 family) [Edaphobacter lichenicola]
MASNRSMNHLRIGTAGWSIPKQYLDVPPQGTHLNRYSQIFNCAEINSSFYRSHRLSTWAKWADSVPEDFQFSVKAPKAITHDAKLACEPAQLQIFLAEANTLAQRLGPILFQLPPSSAFNPAVAKAFFARLRDLHQGAIVFEPRHSTWFVSEADYLLNSFSISRVAADPARVPAAAQAAGWSQLLYCRLHGSPHTYYSAYPESYLRSLAAAIAAHKTRETWCVFDNTASGAAFGDAQILQRLLSAA